jgi:hypothetical protein
MDWGDITENIPIIAMIIGLILLQIFLRRRRGPQTGNQYIAESLMSEIRVNLRLAEVLAEGEPIKRFITTAWKINRNKIEFLEQQVQSALTDAFTIAEDYNQQVAASRKYRSTSYIASIDVQKLQAKLTSSKEGLEQWFLSTTGSKEPPTQSPGIFDGLIGRR